MTGTDSMPVAVENLPDFWDRLHMAGTSLLVLDYDGTIAPFRTERMEAFPFPGIAYLLEKIREKTHGALAVMSGRPVSEIFELLGDLSIMTVGGHGSEFRYPDGTLELVEPTGIQKQGLDKAWDAVVSGAGEGKVERKTMSVALHTRGLEKDDASRIENHAAEKWSIIGESHDLDVMRFNGGIELRCKGVNKGAALLRLLANIRGQVFVVYIGDDETDEDAFKAIDGLGIGIRVAEPGNRTRARGFLRDVHAVKRFLQGWLDHAPGVRSGGMIWKHEDWR